MHSTVDVLLINWDIKILLTHLYVYTVQCINGTVDVLLINWDIKILLTHLYVQLYSTVDKWYSGCLVNKLRHKDFVHIERNC